MLLNMYSGARFNENCALKIKSVYKDNLSIEETKSIAGIRDVPIHSHVKPVFDRLVSNSTEG